MLQVCHREKARGERLKKSKESVATIAKTRRPLCMQANSQVEVLVCEFVSKGCINLAAQRRAYRCTGADTSDSSTLPMAAAAAARLCALSLRRSAPTSGSFSAVSASGGCGWRAASIRALHPQQRSMSGQKTERGEAQSRKKKGKKTEAVRPPCAASQPGECPGGASLSAALLTPARRPPPQTWAWPRHPLPSSAPTALCRRADLHAHGADVSAR